MNYRTYIAASFIVLLPFSLARAEGKLAEKKYDTSLPIAINADNLEVDQAQHTALFTGNVVAIQGKITVKSDSMTVYYRDNGSGASVIGGGGPQAVSKVKVNGNVHVATPNETAKGKRGVYDVEHGVLALEGMVALTQGENIIQGEKLVYNLETGKSVVSSNTEESPESTGEKSKGRVKSIFVPEKK